MDPKGTIDLEPCRYADGRIAFYGLPTMSEKEIRSMMRWKHGRRESKRMFTVLYKVLPACFLISLLLGQVERLIG